MNETGDTNIEYSDGTNNVNLPTRYNYTKISNYINKEINNVKLIINKAFSGSSFRFKFQNWKSDNNIPGPGTIIFQNDVENSVVNANQANMSDASIKNTEVKLIKISHFATGSNNIKNYLDKWNKDDILIAKGINKINNLGIFKIVSKRMDNIYMELQVEIIEPTEDKNDFQIKSSRIFNEIAISFTSKAKIIEYIDTDNKSVFYSTKKLIVKDTDQNPTTTSNTTTNDYSNVALEVIGDINANGIQLTAAQEFNIKSKTNVNKITVRDTGNNFLEIDGKVLFKGDVFKKDSNGIDRAILFDTQTTIPVNLYQVSQFENITIPDTDNQLLAFDVASGKFKLSNQLIDLSNSVGNFTTIVNAIDSFNQTNIETQNNAINTVAGGFQTNKDNIQKNEDRILDLSAGRIKTNEDTIASHQTRITNVETNVLVDLSAGRIKTNEDTIASHQTRITNVETNVLVDLSAGRIKTNEDTIASHGTRITTVETNVLVDLSSGRIKTNEDTIASHGTRITTVETSITDLSSGRIKTNEDTIASHGTRITTVETNVLVDLSAGRIKTNENNIDQHHHWIINDLSDGRIKINENTIASHGTRLQIIDISNQKREQRLDDIYAKITGLNTNIETNSNNISTLNTKINSLDIAPINTTVESIADISANVSDLSKNVAANTNITKHIMLNGNSVGIGFDVSSNIGTGYALDISGTLNCTTLRIGGSIPKLTDTITISGEDYNLDFELENNQYQHDLSSDLIISSTTNSNHAKVQILGVNESVLGMKTMDSGNEGKITWDGEKFKFDKPITCDDILIGGQPSDSFITWRSDKNRGNIFYDKGAVTFGPSGEILPSSHTKMLVKDGSLVVEEEKLNSTSDLNIVKHSSVINNNPFNINFKVKNNNNDASFNKILSDGYKFSTLLDNSLNDLLKVVDGSAVNCIIDVAEDANHNIYALAELTYDLSGYVYSDVDVKTTDNRSSLIKMYKIDPTTNPNTIEGQSQVISHYLWSQNTAAVEDASLNALTKHNSNIYLDSINSRNMKLVVNETDIYISAVLNYVKMNSENKKEFITYNNIFKYTSRTADITQCKTPDEMFVVQGPVNHGSLSERDKYTLGDLKNTTEIQFHNGELYYSKYVDETHTLSIGALRASDLSNNQIRFHYTEDASSKMRCGSFAIDSNHTIYFAADYYLYKVGTIDQPDANPITYSVSNQPGDGILAGTGKLQTIVVDGVLGESTISNVNGVTYKDGKVLILEQTNVNYLRELSGNQLRTKQIFYEDEIALSSYNNTGYLSENHLRSISGELMLLDYTWSPIDIIYDTNQFTSDDYPSKQMYKPLGKIEDLTLTTDVSNIYHELTVANIEIRKDENSTVVTNGNNNVYYYPHDMVFSTSNKWDKPDGEKRMIIKSDGKIGIGLDQPGELLDISGNIRGKKLIVDDISGGVLTSNFVSQPGATKIYDASSLWQKLQGIDGSSNHLLGLINDLSGGRIKDSETDIIDISGRVAKTETDIADLSSGRIKTNEDNIAVNAGHITDISGRVHTNEGDIASNLSLITDLSNGRIKTSEENIAVNAGHMSDISGRVHTNEGDIASNLSLITDLSDGRIKTSEEDILTNVGHISDISGRVQINEYTVSTHTGKIQTNKKDIDTNTGDISDISEKVQNNRTDINSNANAIEDISKNKMAPLQTNFDDLKASVNNHIANINDQYDRNFNLFQNELNKTNISIEGASDSYGMDISNTNIVDGYVLSWDKTGDKWLPKSIDALQGNNTNLEDLNNVDLTGVTTKHIIKYDGTKWVSSDVPLPDAPTIVINNRKAGGIKLGHKSTTFLEMDDDGVLKVSPDLSTLLLQQFQTLDLKINQMNSGVASVALSDGSITDLSDVDISYSTIQQGQALVWNSTENKWEPGVVASSGSDINATTDVSLNNLLVHGNITPDISNTRNIGSETKPFNEMYVKEIFVSNNSIWFGDSNKLSVATDGNLKIQKVNKNKIPKYIEDLSLNELPSGFNTHLHAATARIYPNFNGIKQAKDFTLSHWIEYVNYYYPNTAAAADINFNTLVEGDELEEDTGVIENLVNADLSIHKIDISGDCNVGGVMDASNIQLEGVDISNIFAPIRNPVFTATNNVVFDCSVNIAKTLTVQNIVTTGQYSQLDVQNLQISNSLIGLNDGLTTTNPNDTGIIIERGTTGDNAFIGFKEDTDRFIMGTTTATTSDSGSLTVVPGTLIADLSGTAEIAKVANSLSGLTATASELNILDGCTVTTSQLNNLDNSFNILTANINAKQSLITSNTSLVAKDISANEGKFATLKTVVNGVASDVGSKLKTLESQLNAISATIGTETDIGDNLITIATQANNSATESKNRLDSHDTRLDNHDASLNSIDSSLNVINTQLGKHDTSLNTIDSSLNVIDSRLVAHDTSLNTIDANLNVINTQLGQHDTSLNTIDTSLNVIDSRLVAHDISLNSIDTRLDNHDTSLNTIDISLNVINTQLGQHDTSLNSIDASLNVMDSRLETHDTSLNSIDSKLGNHDTSLNSIDTRLDNHDTSLNSIDSKLGNHDTSLNSIDTSLNVIDGRLETHDTSLNAIDSSLNVINTRLGQHDNSFNDVYTKLENVNTNANASITNINNSINIIDISVNSIEDKLVAHDTSLNIIDISVNSIEDKLVAHDTSLNIIDISVNSIEDKLEAHDTSLNIIDISVNSIEDKLEAHDTSLNTIDASLNVINTRLGQHDNSFNDVYTKLENVNINNSSITDLSDVDISYNTIGDGQALVWNDASGVWQPGNVAAGGGSTTTATKQGQVLETLTGIADGRTVVVESGSYTLTNVTDTLISTTSYTDITGTSINYTPPTGTKQVIFTYHINMSMEQGAPPAIDGNNKRGIILIQMMIDGTAVVSQIQAWGDDTYTYGESFKYKGIIDINGTNDASNGSLASWSTSKTVKLRIISYSDSYRVRLHANQYGDLGTNNTVTNTLIKPRIEINSIGEETTTSGGGGTDITTSSITDLSNVSTTAPSDGQALVWNDASGVWQPGNSGTDITESFITDLSDVDISYSTITNGAHLIWNDIGKKWQAFNPTTTTIEKSNTEIRISHIELDIVETTESPDDTWSSYRFAKVFDNNTDSVVHSYYSSSSSTTVYDSNGNYIGNSSTIDSTNNVYSGMWVQQEYYSPICFTKFIINLRSGSSPTLPTTMSPKEFKVFAGNDGQTWYEINHTELPNNNPGAKEITFQNTDTPYRYIRFVFHSTFGSQYMSFSELEIWGKKAVITTVTNISITNPSDVDVSGNLKVGGDISFNGNLYQNGTLFTGGTTIDSTTDISVNNLDVSGNLKVGATQAHLGQSEFHGWNRYGGSKIHNENYDVNKLYDTTSSYLTNITSDQALLMKFSDTTTYDISGRNDNISANYWFYYGVDNSNNLTINGINPTQTQLQAEGYTYTFELRHFYATNSYARYPKHFVIAGRTTDISDNSNYDSMTSSDEEVLKGWTFICEYKYTGDNLDNEVWNNEPHFFNPGSNHELTNCEFVEAGLNNTDINGRTSKGYSREQCEYHIIKTNATDLPLYSGFAMFILEGGDSWIQLRSWNINIKNTNLSTSASKVSLETEGMIIVGKSKSNLFQGYNLDVSGNGIFSGNIRTNGTILSSDDRLKHNETIPTTPLDTIMKLTPKQYLKTRTMYDASHNFTVDAHGNPMNANGMLLLENNDYTKETGIIAQDLQSIPELNYTVKNNGANEPLGVDYNSIHCLHIAATKELNEKLNAKVIKLEEENAVLRNELSEIKDYLGL